MTRPLIDDATRRRRLVVRHRLTTDRRTDDVEEITRSLVCLHSSDPATVFLSAMVRMRTPSVEAVEDAIYGRRVLVRHHAMRRTLFVFPLDTAAEAHWSTTADIAEQEERRLARVLEVAGVADDGTAWIGAGREEVLDEIRRRGTATTREIGAALPEIAHRFVVQGTTLSTHSRLLLVLGFEGRIVRNRPLGSWIGSQYRWSTMDMSYPGVVDHDDPADADASAATLVDRYLWSFGPVTTNDVAWWTGWGKTRAMAALERAGAVAVDLEIGEGWMAAGDVPTAPSGVDGPNVSFLPGLDATVMGWKDRGFYLDPGMVEYLFDRNGNAGPTIWLDGAIVGGWVQRADGSIATELLDTSARTCRRLIDEEAARVVGMYGQTRHRVRFAGPIHRALYDG